MDTIRVNFEHPMSDRRRLPSVHVVLAHPVLAELGARHGREVVRESVRDVLAEARAGLEAGEEVEPGLEAIVERVAMRLGTRRTVLRPVINATGILLHTGLGRAPLGPEVAAHVAEIASGYSSLELDLETGERGSRTSGVAALLRQITGAAAAAIVNNNAAATLIALGTLAGGREVVVSRGQLIEIGGSFRLPEVFAASGARLREVGTTNRTRLEDYAGAINAETAAILRVHPSNFRIVGFTEEVPIGDLARLARAHGVWCIDDIGSGALAPGMPPGVPDEPTIAQSLAAGAHLVLCSGDKLLGGPQCGLILGDAEAVKRIASSPLMRALRVDKMVLAALEALLLAARSSERAARDITLWALLTTSVDVLEARAGRLRDRLRASLDLDVTVETSEAFLGGGSVPMHAVPSIALRLSPPFPGLHATEGALARALRLDETAVVPRVAQGCLWLDLRTVFEHQDESLAQALEAAMARG